MSKFRSPVFLLTRNSMQLRRIRGTLEQAGCRVQSCCSTASLLRECARRDGCIVVHGDDFCNPEIEKIVQQLRAEGVFNPILVAAFHPTVERAVELMRLPICDFFQWDTCPSVLQTVLRRAENWRDSEGRHLAVKWVLRQNWSQLDPSLQQILRMLYDGKTNRQIAQELGLSLRTVENRRARLLETFQVRSFAELIRTATGFIEGDVLPNSTGARGDGVPSDVDTSAWNEVRAAVHRAGG